jgi:NAD+ kinase
VIHPGSVRSVLVLANSEKPGARALVSELEPWLRARVQSLSVRSDVRAFREERARELEAGKHPPRPDLLVVLGGDGAILGAVHAFGEAPVPTLGINLGQVGFLAATPAAAWREALAACLAGEAVEEPRMQLEAEWEGDGGPRRATALNEITLQRSSHAGMIRAALWAGRAWVTNYRADGVIVATPSGSTAYSLSAGGPIVDPTVQVLLLSPISPHTLSNRPVVLRPTAVVRIAIGRREQDALLTIDGQEVTPLGGGDVIEVRQGRSPVALVRSPDRTYYDVLRSKLGWGAR